MSAAAYNPGVRFFLLGALVLGGAPGAPAEEGGRELPGEWSRFRRPFSEAYWIYEAPAAFRGGEYDGGGTPHVTVNEFRARTAVPLLRNETLIATAGAALQWDHFFFTGISFENIDTWIMGVPFFVSWKPGGTWRLSAAVTPSLYSDLKRVTRDAFGAGGALMASYSWAPGQSVSAGLVYSRIFGSQRLFPAAGLILHPGPDWELRLVFPQPAVRYAPCPGLNLVAGMTPAGGQWRIANPVREEDGDCDFTFKGYRAGAGLEIALFGPVILSLDGGFTFARDYRIENDVEDVLDTRAGDTFGFRLGLLAVR